MSPAIPSAPKRSKIPLFAGAFIILFGLIFGGTGYYLFNLEREYASGGRTVQGSVLSKRAEERWEKDSETKKQRKTTTYYVGYRFNTPDGQAHDSSDSVPLSDYQQYSEGGALQIQYLTRDPAHSRVAHDPEYVLCSVFMAVGALLILGGGAFAGYDIKKRVLIRRLLREGTTVDGNVNAVFPGSLWINDVQQWRIRYSFNDTRGKEHSAESGHMPRQEAEAWKAGDRAKVIYDRERPDLNIWIGR